MVLITGIAATAAGAIVIFRRMQEGEFGEPAEVIRSVRQVTGVILAVANFVRATLDALQLINRRGPSPAPSGAVSSVLRPIIGVRAGDVDND